MGYHVKYEELQSVQQNILNQIDNWYNQLEEVAKKLVDVAEMDHIKGATGKSIKNYIYEVHIPIIQMFTQLLAEYETKFLIYANEYYEIDSSTSAEIAQDELEDQMERLNEKKGVFNESDESLRKTLEGISDIISLRAPSTYGVRSNYTGLYNKAENLRDKIGEHEENHFSSDFDIMDEMLSNLSGLINNQIGKSDFSITNYEVGAITKLSNYETLSELFAKQQDYLSNSIKERAKAMEGYNIRQQILAEEAYAKERIAEGGLQTVGGVISVVAGAGLIIATAGAATPIVAGALVVGTCSMTYGLSNTEEGLDNVYYGIKGDGKSIAVNPIRDTYFASNPELYYKIGNASTIISSLGAPIASGVPVEQVMATRVKGIVSSAVGVTASNALMDRYDLNPYIAMGIGMGISGITYKGIDAVGNVDYVNKIGAKPVEAASMDRKKLDTSIFDIDKRSMTGDDLRELRRVAKQMEATPENAVRIGSEKTWNEFLKNNPSSDLNKSAEDYIKLITDTNPWPDGKQGVPNTLPAGTKVRMAMAPGQSDLKPGGWGTLDEITSIDDARTKLAIMREFKEDIDRINIYEIVEKVPVMEGKVGPQIDLLDNIYLPGGGNQVKLDIDRKLRNVYLKKVDEIILK